MKPFKVFILISVIAVTYNIQAQVGLRKVAQSTMNFQLVSISPRASAMGEAFVAVGQGAESIFFNPAGIVETSSLFAVKMFMTQWIADITYMAGAVVWNAGNIGSIGIGYLWVDYGNIYGTSLILPEEQELYPLGYRDDGYVSHVGAYSLGLTYGRAISDRFLIGGNIRLAGQNLGQNRIQDNALKNNDAQKLVFDAGVKYYTGFKSFRFGMAIRNFSSNIKREEISEQLPLLFTMGLAIDLFDVVSPDYIEEHSLTLAVDFLHPNNFTERIHIGLEYRFWNAIALRGGYQTNQDLASWSLGMGLSQAFGKNQIEFDFSYTNFDIFQNVNRFSIGMQF